MPSVCSKLYNKFSKDSIPSIRLSFTKVKNLIEKVGTKEMGDHHKGTMEFVETEEAFSKLHVLHTKLHKEKMAALVTDKKFVAFLFGRMGPTNFAKALLEISTNAGTLRVSCIEQLFQLHKALFIVANGNCPNFDEEVFEIFWATTPFGAKGAGNRLGGFMEIKAAWDAEGPKYMYASILFACTNPETFYRYQSMVTKVPDETMAALMNEGKFAVYEANNDKIWGIDKFTQQVLQILAERGEDFDLEQAMTDIAGTTTNILGRMLTDFLSTIRDMTHEEFMQQVEGIKFFEVVDEEEEEDKEPPAKRQCSQDAC